MENEFSSRTAIGTVHFVERQINWKKLQSTVSRFGNFPEYHEISPKFGIAIFLRQQESSSHATFWYKICAYPESTVSYHSSVHIYYGLLTRILRKILGVKHLIAPSVTRPRISRITAKQSHEESNIIYHPLFYLFIDLRFLA